MPLDGEIDRTEDREGPDETLGPNRAGMSAEDLRTGSRSG
jgi:hypothetical protein